MFEVLYDGFFYKVYNIRDNGAKEPDFLLYINYHWTWVSCVHCTLVK